MSRWHEDTKVGDRVMVDKNNHGTVIAANDLTITVRWDNGVWDDMVHWRGCTSLQVVPPEEGSMAAGFPKVVEITAFGCSRPTCVVLYKNPRRWIIDLGGVANSGILEEIGRGLESGCSSGGYTSQPENVSIVWSVRKINQS